MKSSFTAMLLLWSSHQVHPSFGFVTLRQSQSRISSLPSFQTNHNHNHNHNQNHNYNHNYIHNPNHKHKLHCLQASKTNNHSKLMHELTKGVTSTLVLFSLLLNTPQVNFEWNQNSHNHIFNNQFEFQFQLQFQPATARAESYGSLSDEQKAVAEAWRVVDNTFIDRSFNHQDWFKLRQDLVKNKKYKSMNEAQDAISTMMGSLGDKYTRYLPPEKYQSLVNSATGTLAGIGVEIGQTPSSVATTPSGGGVARVQANDVEDKSPAQTAGIQPLDVFLEVDGKNVETATPDEVAQLVRGPVGSKVGVVMERDGKKLDFIITREKITVTSVKSYLSGKTGVVRIKNFSGTTSSTVSEAIDSLKKKGANAFVIDVRSNPGGLLPGGVETASLFLEDNKSVVFVVDKSGVVDAQKTLTTGTDIESPLVIFVNDQTASASEVFTAALQENQRATVVGESSDHTFGKGIVQTIRELSNGNGGVAVTIARYETPLHNDINKKGISVDLKVDACSTKDAASCIPASAFRKPAN